MELKRHSEVEVEVTELCEPTGDDMFKYIYIYDINVMNPDTRALDVQTCV